MHHIYIHIPFCLKKCAYCDFYSLTDLSLINSYIDAICSEIVDSKAEYAANEVETLYLGGGTPSILSVDQLSRIISQLHLIYKFSTNIEITLEANPETIEKTKLKEFKDLGINRLSMGVQSFVDAELAYLGRIHTADTARKALQVAVDTFDNVSCDLMFGLPGQMKADLEKNLKEVSIFSPRHISCYELTYEEDTPLYAKRDQRVDDDGKLYLFVRDLLEKYGYHQYEISNYANRGYECRHNLAYWSDESYIGFGAAAHSYDKDKGERWANTDDILRYLNGEKKAFLEKAEEIDKMIMSLRKIDGMPFVSIPERYHEAVANLINESLLQRKRDKVAFTKRGLLLANKVLLEIALQG